MYTFAALNFPAERISQAISSARRQGPLLLCEDVEVNKMPPLGSYVIGSVTPPISPIESAFVGLTVQRWILQSRPILLDP